jgi:hypothetical protein
LIASAIIAALVIVGVGFLLSSAYLALENAFSATVAALQVGSGLVLAAGLVALIVTLINDRSTAVSAVVPTPVVSARPALINDLQSVEVMAQQLGIVLRNLNPVTIALLGAGILVGILQRR